jgi:excinuclease ABC subunit A
VTKQKEYIRISNAKEHNLKGIDAEFELGSFTVVTGVSGSGKSSLVFDTLFAEGQRRYVESLSAYARQFLGRMKKPAVDSIEGLCPAIAIEQKVNTRNPRSTVATSTEIYDYLKLLFSRVGKTISPVSGRQVKQDSPQDVVDAALADFNGKRIWICAPLIEGQYKAEDWALMQQKGFNRVAWELNDYPLADLIESKQEYSGSPLLIVDRLRIDAEDTEVESRLFDAIETAFWEGNGNCSLVDLESKKILEFNNRFELDGMTFETPSQDFLSFNNPYGACRTCEGFGSVLGIDEELVIPDSSLSVHEGAVAPWKGETLGLWKNEFIRAALKLDFPIHRPYRELTKSELDLLWNGGKGVEGIRQFFSYLEEKSYKIQYRVLAARYRGKTTCHDCKGTRLRKEASWVKLHNINAQADQSEWMNLPDLLLMQIDEASSYFQQAKLSDQDSHVAERIWTEIQSRLLFLQNVGLGYLTLNRLSNTLSGGESQRINLATSLGSNLTGSLYVLDEPSIGLHSRDTERLIGVLKSLQEEGNTVVVVEHDEDVMANADNILDIGPLAGSGGGHLVFSGDLQQIKKDAQSLTGQYLNGTECIAVPEKRRPMIQKIRLEGARANNLKDVSIEVPLEALTVVTGVSGSGKTSLIKGVLFPAISRHLGQFSGTKQGKFKSLGGDIHLIKGVELVDQNPIGKSSRSNPVTYVKAFDEIRELFAAQPLAHFQGFKPSHFSFNVDGGRCDSCSGEGESVIEMQFMADIKLPCDACGGKRYKKDVLEVTFKDKNIFDVLEMTVEEALQFFQDHKGIHERLQPLADVGLGYVKLGQGSNTLSGGEAQRVKLAFYLSKASPHKEGGTLFVFDEPTTGLHFHDIKKLLSSLQALIRRGHTVLCIEHNLDVAKCADWIIDLGPEAGEEGGSLVFQGTPEGLIEVKESVTAPYLKAKLNAAL